MLKGISPLLSPELLKILASMGHGDEILLADAHYPGEGLHTRVTRADGIKIKDLLGAIMPLFELDSYVDAPLIMMEAVKGDTPNLATENSYLKEIALFCQDKPSILKLERFQFYERSKKAFAIVMTGETAAYGNIILKKGLIIH